MSYKTRSLSKHKKKRTLKRHKGKRIWLYRRGNIVFCYRTPYLSISQMKKGGLSGGDSKGSPDEDKLATLFFEKLPEVLKDKDINAFLKQQDKTKLASSFLNSSSIKDKDFVLEELKKSTPTISEGSNLNSAGKVLLEWVKKKLMANQLVEQIKAQAKGNPYTEKDWETIEKTLNNENVCDAKPSLTSMSSSAFNKLSQGAVSLGQLLAPASSETEKNRRHNDTNVQLLWYPRSNINYRKGNSIATPKDKIKYGDFMIYTEPEQYADIPAYLTNVADDVEDYFTNILGACEDGFCLKGSVAPQPYKHQVLQISNYQPEIDDKEMNQTSIQRK